MSNTITNLCRPLRLQPVRKCVLMALADRADDNGIAWPSLAWLCEWTCYGRRTVMDALADLKASGLVRITENKGRNSSYEIDLKALGAQMVTPPESPGVSAADADAKGDPNPGGSRTGAGPAPVQEPHWYPGRSRTGVGQEPHGGGAGAAPDTSISIIDTSIKTSNSCLIGAANVAAPTLFELDSVDQQQAPPVKQKHQYSPEFEASWTAYPTRPGDSKQSAFKQWQARLKAGATAEEMAAGIVAYASYVETNRTEPRFIKHAATFLGQDMHFRNDWSVAASTGRESRSYASGAPGRVHLPHSGFDKINYSEGIDENGYITG